MHPGVAVSAVTDGTEAVALGMGSRAIARGLGARAIADGQDATASAYGLGAIAIAINGGTAYAHEGATIKHPQNRRILLRDEQKIINDELIKI
jgi:hypothetical protein